MAERARKRQREKEREREREKEIEDANACMHGRECCHSPVAVNFD